MKQADNHLRTLEFQGQPIYYLSLPEGNLLLIRPLCEVLGVDTDNQLEKLKEDEILRDEHSVQSVRLPEYDRSRQWACLPERFVYGWLFGIQFTNTMSEQTKANLTAYKRDCYNVLFDHFHGRLKQTQELDKEEAIIDLELEAVEKRLQKKLQIDPDHLRKLELRPRRSWCSAPSARAASTTSKRPSTSPWVCRSRKATPKTPNSLPNLSVQTPQIPLYLISKKPRQHRAGGAFYA
jgi:hypothetical protein